MKKRIVLLSLLLFISLANVINVMAEGGHESSPASSPASSATTTLPDGVPTPIKVGTALILNNLAKINESTNSFEANIDLQLRWKDPRLAFDIKEKGTDRLEYGLEAATAKLATIWNPGIIIANMNDKPLRSEPGLFIYQDGTVVYVQRLRAVFESKFKLASFPFDSQALSIKLLSTKYNINEVEFSQAQKDINLSGVREGTTFSGWKLKGITFTPSRSRGWNGDYFPQFEAQIIILREPVSHMLVIFIPILLIILVPSVMTLYAKVDVAPRLTAWSASILAMIALNFTFSVKYPALDSESLISQMLATIFTFQMIMVVLTVSILSPVVSDRLGNKFLVAEIVAYLRWSVPVGLLAFIIVRILLTALT